MTRPCKMPVRPVRAPLAASAETPRLAYLPGLTDAHGESLAALVAGHPRRPMVLRVFPTIAAALVALREMNSGRPA